MKLINQALVFLCMFTLLSCDSDNGVNQPLTQDDIQGEWFLSELNASQPADLNNDEVSSIDLTTETDCFDGVKVNFENDAYSFTYPKIEFTGDEDQTLICTDALNEGMYILDNGILTATTNIDGSTSTESVTVNLSADQLIFTITAEQVSEYLDLGSVENQNSNLEFLEFIFEK